MTIQDRPRDIEQEWPVFAARQTARERLSALIEDPEIAQTVWDTYVSPMDDAMAARQVYTLLLRCRVCSKPHPASPTAVTWTAKGRPLPGHMMSCPHYVGPLEHHKTGGHQALMGWHADCSCGKSYPDDLWAAPPDHCPDAAIDWRGPRP